MSTWDAVKLAARKVVARTQIFCLEIKQEEEEHMLSYYKSIEDKDRITPQMSKCFGLSVRIANLKASL